MNTFYARLQWVALLPVALLMWSGAADQVMGWPDPLHELASFNRVDLLASIGALCALAIETIGPLALLIRPCRGVAALVLAAYTVTAALLFHDFWRADDLAHSQLQDFLRNLALAGSLLFVFAASRGREAVVESPLFLDYPEPLHPPGRVGWAPPPQTRNPRLRGIHAPLR